MNALQKTFALTAITALGLFASGCSTASMKGTPFYTGEYAKRRGPAEQRVNGWPLLYYRDPALSVLWPLFEFTDDHTAVRPFFSVYGLNESNREYNVFWPLAQFDRKSGDNRVFPLFWGREHFVAFPAYWHLQQPWGTNGGTDALFPLWVVNREHTNELTAWALWPLLRYAYDRKAGEHSSMIFPLYWQGRDRDGALFVSLPWMSGHDTHGSWRVMPPLFYQSSNDTRSTLITPLWAAGRSQDDEWQAIIPFAYWDRNTLLSPLWAHWQRSGSNTYLAPWAASWGRQQPERTDLWLAGGLAHASFGQKAGAHHVLPMYYRDAPQGTLLTPLFGWNERRDYFYPLTPLAGVRTDQHSGSWLFPLYSHDRNKQSGALNQHFLLLGGYAETKQHKHAYYYPLFSYRDRGPVNSQPEVSQRYGRYGTDFWCLPYCWAKNESTVRLQNRPAAKPRAAAPEADQPAWIRTDTRTHGVFPLWSYTAAATPAEGKASVDGSTFGWLYDYKHEIERAPAAKARDYTRARVLWRLWHYERLNGDVSVDVFPGFTHDRKTDGYQKTSWLWRLFRYEGDAEGARKLDVLFVPLKR